MNPNANQEITSAVRSVRGLKAAMNKMMDAFRADVERRENAYRNIQSRDQTIKNPENNNEQEVKMKNTVSSNKSSYKVFQNESNEVSVSDRVAEASKSHLNRIEKMEKLSSLGQSHKTNSLQKASANIQAQQKASEQQSKPQHVEKKTEQANIFGQPQKISSNIFDNKPPQASNSLFGSKQQTANIFATKPIVPGKNIFQSSITEVKNVPILEKPSSNEAVEMNQQEPTKASIFAQGLFQENNKKPKPVLIFNNNQQPSQGSEKKQKSTPIQPAIKLLFNNNGAVVQKIKPQVNIFNSGQPFEEVKNQQHKNPPMQIIQNVSQKKGNIFEHPKMEVQQVPVQKSLFSNSNQEKKQTNKEQSTKPNLFNNNSSSSNIFTASQPNPAQNIFSNQSKSQELFNNSATQPLSTTNQVQNPFLKPVPPNQSETIIPKVSLFEQNTTSNIFLKSAQESQNKGGLFGRKEQPKLEEKQQLKEQNIQNNNIFNTQNNNNIFGKKPQTQQKVSQPTGGLFGTPNTENNIFNQPKPETNLFNINKKASDNEKKIEEIKQDLKSQKISFAQSLKGSNMFAKVQKKEQNKIVESQPENIFGKASQNNIFMKPSQTNFFSQQSQPTGSASLFGNKANDNKKRGAALFSQQEIAEKSDDEQGEGEYEDEDGLIKSNMVEGNESEVAYDKYQKTDVFAKVEAIKFKVVKENKLLDHVKLSLEKLQGDDKIYIIVRNPNKTSKCLGVLLPNSELKIISKDDASDVSFSIHNLIQINLPEQIKQTLQSWRIMIKKSEQSTKFIEKVKQIIEDLKKKQQKKN